MAKLRPSHRHCVQCGARKYIAEIVIGEKIAIPLCIDCRCKLSNTLHTYIEGEEKPTAPYYKARSI